MIPRKSKEIAFGNEKIEVREMRVKEALQVLEKLPDGIGMERIPDERKADEKGKPGSTFGMKFSLKLNNVPGVIRVVGPSCIAINSKLLTLAEFEELPISCSAQIVSAFVEVNSDFFAEMKGVQPQENQVKPEN